MRLRRPSRTIRRRLGSALVRLALLVAALLAAAAAPALELVVEAPAELAAEAARVRSLAGLDIAGPLALTGLADPGPPIRVILAGEHSELAARAPTWVAGYALGALSTVVLFPSRVPSYPDRNLEVLVAHEVTHVLVARAAAGHAVPRWFDEGLATVAAREWAIEDRARTALALVGYRPQSIREVTEGFTGDGAAVARAYALSASFVRFILRRHSPASTGRILALIAAGEPFEEAFRHATGAPLSEVESAFFRREAFWGTWMPFLTSSGALWMGVTALALLAIRRRRRRDAEVRERWAREEAAPVPATSEVDAESAGDSRRWN